VAGAGVSDLSLRRADAKRTIHYVIGRRMAARFYHDDGRRFDETVEWDDPKMRAAIGYTMCAAWGILATVCTFGILIGGFGLRALGAEAAANAFATACFALCMFCFAGALACLWRAYWYSWRARRLAPYGVNEAERYAAAMRRTLPRNTSVVFQVVFAILVTIWANGMSS
jgi:hypothetical protein